MEASSSAYDSLLFAGINAQGFSPQSGRAPGMAFTTSRIPSGGLSLEPVKMMFQNLGWYSPNETLILS